jgi:hypothetical protein
MKQNVFLIQTDTPHKGPLADRPYRTGTRAKAGEDWIRKNVHGSELVALILKNRFTFLHKAVWVALGLPDNGPKKELYCAVIERKEVLGDGTVIWHKGYNEYYHGLNEADVRQQHAWGDPERLTRCLAVAKPIGGFATEEEAAQGKLFLD